LLFRRDKVFGARDDVRVFNARQRLDAADQTPLGPGAAAELRSEPAGKSMSNWVAWEQLSP
jgi:hypothetical protein